MKLKKLTLLVYGFVMAASFFLPATAYAAYARGDTSKCVDGFDIPRIPDSVTDPEIIKNWNTAACNSDNHGGYDPNGNDRCDGGQVIDYTGYYNAADQSPDLRKYQESYCRSPSIKSDYTKPITTPTGSGPSSSGTSEGCTIKENMAIGCEGYTNPESGFNCGINPGNNNTGACFKDYLNAIIKVVGGAVGIIIIIMIIIGGIRYSASSGDPSAAAAAKKMILNALVGLMAFIFMGTALQYLVPGGIFRGPPFGPVAADCSKGGTFFGLPTWYRYLDVKTYTPPGEDTICKIMIKDNWNNILLIGLAVVDILLRISTLVAIGYVIYGGIKYITSQGEPENAKTARRTILNALIGLAIAVVASGLVAFIARQVTT